MFQRAELEKLLRPIIERTIPLCFDALEQAEARAGVKLSDVDAIVLAGGSTHVPRVRQIVRENLSALVDGAGGGADQRAAPARAKCAEPVYDSVDTVVARGAAIRAAATGGLSVTNPERTVRVSFRGLGATGAREIHVGGTVDALDAGLELVGGTIRVIIPELDFEDTQDLGQGGAFAFRRLPLQPSAENLLNFEVCDANGVVVATAGRPMTQDRDVRPSGGVDGVAVLSKDISLEVRRAGKVTRHVLVPALTSLPHTVDQSFLHPGDTEQVRIVLFQQRRKIKELPVDVPSTLPRGTPIALNVNIDKLAYITVKGTIGNVPFDIDVVAPPDREVPSPTEETALRRQFEEAVSYLPPGQKNVKELEYEEAKSRYEKAAQQGDAAGAVHEYEAMEELVASVEEVDGPLTPPKAFLDNLVRDCLELHQYIDRKSPNGVPYDGPEMVRSIDVQREEAERAFAASDQQAYTDAITMLHNIEDHLRDIAAQVEGKDGTSTPDERQQAAGMVAYGRNKAGKLMSIAEPDRPDLAKELDGVDVRLSQLAGQVEGDPSGVMERARPLLQNLDRIENILQGGRRGMGDLPESSQ
jgi:molecular chaperone DnaK